MNRAYTVGAPADLLRNAAVWNPDDWFPTIIAPFKSGGVVNKFFFWWHLIVWILLMGLSGTANGGTFYWQRKITGCAPLDETCFKVGASTFTSIVGWVATASCIFTVIMIVVSASVWKIDEARREVEYFMILFFFFSTSLVGSFWIFTEATHALASIAFYLSTATVILHVYAGVLLYSCLSAMKMVTVSRTTIPMFATALSILVACAIQLNEISLGDDWTSGKPFAFSYGQKFTAFLVPSFQLAGILAMVVLRRITANEDSISEIENSPFVRTTILFSFFFSACVNVYVYSFCRMDTDMSSGMIAMASMLMSSFSVLVVFNPDAKGEYASTEYDWEK